MGRYVVRRVLYMLVVLLVVSMITFLLMHAVPGGPFTTEKALPAETIKVLNERYHLNDPLWKQYTDYVYNTMIPHVTTTAPTTSLLDDYLTYRHRHESPLDVPGSGPQRRSAPGPSALHPPRRRRFYCGPSAP